jgi:hypothetical protein
MLIQFSAKLGCIQASLGILFSGAQRPGLETNATLAIYWALYPKKPFFFFLVLLKLTTSTGMYKYKYPKVTCSKLKNNSKKTKGRRRPTFQGGSLITCH